MTSDWTACPPKQRRDLHKHVLPPDSGPKLSAPRAAPRRPAVIDFPVPAPRCPARPRSESSEAEPVMSRLGCAKLVSGIGDLGWVTSGRVRFRVTCQCSVAEGSCGKAWRAEADPRLVGLMEDNAWRRRSVFGFYPPPPTGLSQGGAGQGGLVSGLPGLVIPTK
jgi:hypothetical protein